MKNVNLTIKDLILISGLLISTGGYLYKLNALENEVLIMKSDLKVLNKTVPVLEANYDNIKEDVKEIKTGINKLIDIIARQ